MWPSTGCQTVLDTYPMKEVSHWFTQRRILLQRGTKCVTSKSISSSDAVLHASQLPSQYFHSVIHLSSNTHLPVCVLHGAACIKNQPLAFSQISPSTQTSGVDTLMHVWMHALNCTDPRHMTIIFENSTGKCFVYITVVLVQPVGWSVMVCLYAGADWLKLICQSEGGQRSADKAGKPTFPAPCFPHGQKHSSFDAKTLQFGNISRHDTLWNKALQGRGLFFLPCAYLTQLAGFQYGEVQQEHGQHGNLNTQVTLCLSDSSHL